MIIIVIDSRPRKSQSSFDTLLPWSSWRSTDETARREQNGETQIGWTGPRWCLSLKLRSERIYMPVPAVLAWHGRSFIYLRQLVQKRGGGEATPWEEGERRDFADCRTLYLPHPLPPSSLAFFRHDSTRLTMGIWVVERLMLVSTARGQPRISTLEPGKFNGRPRKWLERQHRFGKVNKRLLETWTFGFCNSSSAISLWNSFFGEEYFIPEESASVPSRTKLRIVVDDRYKMEPTCFQ